jgi:hypothetical protein
MSKMSNPMHRTRLTAVGAIALLLSSPVHVARAQEPAARRGPSSTAASPAPVTTGTIVGTAWRGDTTPFPHARIRLRNITTGRGVGVTVTNSDGIFRFDHVEAGAYVVELLAQDDKVLATGDLFSVSAAMQSVTVVRLTTRTPWFGGFFGNAAAAAIAAASTLGVTATGSNGRPVSPQ